MNGDVYAEIRPQNVIAEKPALSGRFERHVQSLDGDRVIGAGVNDSFGGSDGVRADDQSFQHLMRTAFHDAPVHVGRRVAFVAVDQNKTLAVVGWSGRRFFPFVTGDEPAAAFAAQAGFNNLVADFFWFHSGEGFFQRLVAADRNVFVDVLRVDDAAKLQRDPGLLLYLLVIVVLGRGFFEYFSAHDMVF